MIFGVYVTTHNVANLSRAYELNSKTQPFSKKSYDFITEEAMRLGQDTWMTSKVRDDLQNHI